MFAFIGRLLARFLPSERTTGFPTSSNRASSFHLNWELPATGPIVMAEATLEVVDPPQVDHLYFWALQAGFRDATRRGAGHLGLQWHPAHPGNNAVNWGGYNSQGAILDGTESSLPSVRNNRNTRDFAWSPRTRYRFRIAQGSEPGWWRGEVENLESGEVTVVRELHGGGDRLERFMVWSEVFARCDDPSVTVRWSDFAVTDVAGVTTRPTAIRVNYQTQENGGCANTNSVAEADGYLQVTNSRRTTPQGSTLRPGG